MPVRKLSSVFLVVAIMLGTLSCGAGRARGGGLGGGVSNITVMDPGQFEVTRELIREEVAKAIENEEGEKAFGRRTAEELSACLGALVTTSRDRLPVYLTGRVRLVNRYWLRKRGGVVEVDFSPEDCRMVKDFLHTAKTLGVAK